MISPVRCLSSHLTTPLMEKFRNEQGGEENWINHEQRKNNIALYCGKVVVTEIAVSLLCVVAAIETIAYFILLLPCLMVYPISSRPTNFCLSLLSSSAFTCFWNFGNTLVFNPVYTNLSTHESFARFSIDNSPRGNVYQVALKVLGFALEILGLIIGVHNNSGGGPNLFEHGFTRNEDSAYIAEWARRHFPHGLHAQGENLSAAGNLQPQRVDNTRAYVLAQRGLEVSRKIDEGTTFFNQYFLEDESVHDVTKEAIRDCDPDVFEFVLARAIYLYAFHEQLKTTTPSFFSEETCAKIKEVQAGNYSSQLVDSFREYVQNKEKFAAPPEDHQQKQLFNRLKGIAYGELRGLFVKNCCKEQPLE